MKKKSNYLIVILLISLIIFSYSIKLTHYSISIDNEIFLNDAHGMIKDWYQLGRFGLGFYKYIFNNYNLNIMLTSFLSLIILFAAAFLFARDIAKKFSKDHFLLNIFIIVGFILTAPVLTDQFIFTMQMLEVSISYLLLVIAFIMINRVIYQKKYYLLIFIMPLLFLIFGTYQAFYLLYIAFSNIYFISYTKEKEISIKEQFSIIIKYILIFFCGMIGSFIINKIVLNVFHITNSSYLTNQILYFRRPFIYCFLHIGKYMFDVLFGKFPFFNFSYLIGIIFLFKYLKTRQFKYKFSIIPYLFLIFVPFLFTVIFGNETLNRIQFALPVIISFIFVLSLNNQKKVVYLIPIIFIIIQSIITFFLYQGDYKRYKKDINVAYQIKEVIEEYPGKPIVFVGTISPVAKIRGETIGNSFFNWDYDTEFGSNYRIHGFLNALEINYPAPSLEQIKKVDEIYNSLNKKVTVYQDILVVVLDYYN